MSKFAASILFGVTLMAPLTVPAAHADDKDHRYYDRDRKDYHEWNEAEERAYRRYWAERNHDRQVMEWNRATPEQQREYWRWRHEHPDRDHDGDRR